MFHYSKHFLDIAVLAKPLTPEVKELNHKEEVKENDKIIAWKEYLQIVNINVSNNIVDCK